MKRQTGGSSNSEELQTTGGGGGGGTVDQGSGGASPWLVEIDPSQLPLPVSASIDPTGLATSAKQDTGNTSLASIDSKLTNPLPVSGTVTATVASTLVAGTVADGATANNNPVVVGGIAKSPDGTTPGTVSAEDDAGRFIIDLNRRQFVNPVHPTTVKAHFDGSSAYTDQTIASAPGSTLQIVITNIIFSSGAATAISLFLEECSTKIFGPIYLEAVAGRGFASGPIYLPITANTAVTFTTTANIAQSIDISYFTQKV